MSQEYVQFRMESTLSKLVNTKIIVLGPALFDEEKLESVKLIAVEDGGIWIESEEATNRLVDKFRVKPSAPGLAFFIPFSQITSILANLEQASAPQSSS